MENKIEGRFWIKKGEKNFLGAGRIELLKNIQKYGSISKAAKAMKMSYKAAWDAVDIMNNLSEKPILEKISGGKGGGGSRLTEYGKKLIKDFEELQKNYDNFLQNLQNFDKRVFGLKISARNRLLCKIKKITCKDDLCQLDLVMRDGLLIKSKISNDAIKELNLKENDEVIAVIKSTSVKIYNFFNENFLKANVKDIKEGKNFNKVIFQLENGYTIHSITDLKIDPSKEYYLYFTPEDVLIGI